MKAKNKPVATEMIGKTVKLIFTADNATAEHITDVRQLDSHKIMVITNFCVSVVTY